MLGGEARLQKCLSGSIIRAFQFKAQAGKIHFIVVTDAEARLMMIEHLRGLFPKTCPKCRRIFPTLRDYFLNTTPVGEAVSIDLEANDLRPLRPLGSGAVSKCKCGASMVISSDGMPLFRLWSLLLWAKYETMRRNVTPKQLMQSLRAEIRKQVINEGD